MKKLLLFICILLVGYISAQKTHKVAQGETPYGISKKYGISLENLYNLNPGIKNGVIEIGADLIVSGKPKVQVFTPAENVDIVLQPKQTIYGLTKQYKISEADLRKLNPDLDNHMKIGERITIPLSKYEKYGEGQPLATEVAILKDNADSNIPVSTYSTSTVSNDFLLYTVQNGDTTFGILNKFNISLEELMQLNPSLSNGLKAGMILKIKKVAAGYEKKSGDALNVVIMLPFGYENGDTKYKEISLDFMMGAKLAIERNVKGGQQLNIQVIDAGNEATFKNSLSQIKLDATDLIIGPLFKPSVIEVLEYVKFAKIPVVAPFANSAELYKYENLIIIETDDQKYADKIAEEVKSIYSNQKIFIVAGSDKKYAASIKKDIENKFNSAWIEIVNSSSEITVSTNLMTGQEAPVIAILADKGTTEGNNFANKMVELSKKTSAVKAFSMFYSSLFDTKVDDLRNVNLVYLMDRKINMDGAFENEIMSAYKSKYCKSPSKYAVIGFDVVNDMLSRENKKGEIFKQITKSQTQLATKFDFERVNGNGAYINTGYRVVRLMP